MRQSASQASARAPNVVRMRLAAALVLLSLFAACGQSALERAPAPPSAPPGPVGDFKAQSSTARGITGDVSIETAGLRFANGVILYTRTLNPRSGGDLIAKSGATYAASALGHRRYRLNCAM
ncbi:MAG: hypothetical protein JNM59_02955 [Hyphomonadaceae bacterium]|nr:hypothetical protein [Hyphomonadaceae bacterium]